MDIYKLYYSTIQYGYVEKSFGEKYVEHIYIIVALKGIKISKKFNDVC